MTQEDNVFSYIVVNVVVTLYILNQNNTVTMELTGYGASQYAVYKNRALLYFAEAYQDVYDLVEYV